MARNITISLTGNETQEIKIGESYDSCILRSIVTDGSGSLLLEWKDPLSNWNEFKGGQISTSQLDPVYCRIHGNIINEIRVTTSGFSASDDVDVELFLSSDLIASIDEYASDDQLKTLASTELMAAFNEGRRFRFDYDVVMSQSDEEMWFKFVTTSDIDLTLSELNLVEGGLHYEVFASSVVTETSTFDTDIGRVYPMNTRVSGSPELTCYIGGTATTNGDANTNLYVRTASGAGNRSSTLSNESSRRGFPSTTVYVRMTPLSGVNTDILGTYKLEWEVVV